MTEEKAPRDHRETRSGYSWWFFAAMSVEPGVRIIDDRIPPAFSQQYIDEGKGLLREKRHSAEDWVPVSSGDGYLWMKWMAACGATSLFLLLALLFISVTGTHPAPSPLPKVLANQSVAVAVPA